MNTTSVETTAGLGGFLVLFGLALAVWFLGRDLTRRLRRMRRAEEERLATTRRVEGTPDSDETPDPDDEHDPLA